MTTSRRPLLSIDDQLRAVQALLRTCTLLAVDGAVPGRLVRAVLQSYSGPQLVAAVGAIEGAVLGLADLLGHVAAVAGADPEACRFAKGAAEDLQAAADNVGAASALLGLHVDAGEVTAWAARLQPVTARELYDRFIAAPDVGPPPPSDAETDGAIYTFRGPWLTIRCQHCQHRQHVHSGGPCPGCGVVRMPIAIPNAVLEVGADDQVEQLNTELAAAAFDEVLADVVDKGSTNLRCRRCGRTWFDVDVAAVPALSNDHDAQGCEGADDGARG